MIEATGTYRWLYDLLRPYGTVVLAHPLRLPAMIQRRSKTDKLDAQLLANLLRINQIPLAFIPPEPYQELRDLTPIPLIPFEQGRHAGPLISELDGWPTCAPVNASPAMLPPPAHDSGLEWIAIPFPCGSFIRSCRL